MPLNPPFNTSGPYVDPNITSDGPFDGQVAGPVIPRTPNKGAQTTVYDNADVDKVGPFGAGSHVYPHAPNKWRHGRDPYANGGLDDGIG